MVAYNSSCLVEKGAAAFNGGASDLCAHHQDPHLSFVPTWDSPTFPCKPAPLVHFYLPRVLLLQRSTSKEPSPEGFLLEWWLSTGTSLQSGHLLPKPRPKIEMKLADKPTSGGKPSPLGRSPRFQKRVASFLQNA